MILCVCGIHILLSIRNANSDQILALLKEAVAERCPKNSCTEVSRWCISGIVDVSLVNGMLGIFGIEAAKGFEWFYGFDKKKLKASSTYCNMLVYYSYLFGIHDV